MDDLVSSEASFRQRMTDEKTRLVDGIAGREEHALGMDGRGILALVNASGVTTTLTGPGNISGANFGNRFIDVGMFLAAINPASGALRTNVRQVLSTSSDGTSVTFTADPTSAVIRQPWRRSRRYGRPGYRAEKASLGTPAPIDDGTNRTTTWYLAQHDLRPEPRCRWSDSLARHSARDVV
jgi:hypothetical protein